MPATRSALSSPRPTTCAPRPSACSTTSRSSARPPSVTPPRCWPTPRSRPSACRVEANAKLAEQIERRGQLAERRIATAEAQATADVKAAAAELAAQMAEQILTKRLAGAKTDPLIDSAIRQMAGKLQ